MAVSFPRPDPSSPASIARANFGTARKGFDQQEVREFLAQVAAEMGRLREREQYLESSLLESRDAKHATTELIDEDTATRLLGEEAAHILHAARESAASVKAKAEDGASTILGDATEEAARVREEAEVEAARRRSEATADAENQIAMAKQQGREMVTEARSYRERVLSELARRRDLARTQIEQLIHGREQLLGSFNQARDTADGVIRQLGPIGDAATPFDLPPPPPAPPTDAGEESEVESIVDEELRSGAFFDQDAFDGAGPVEPAFGDDSVAGTDSAVAGTDVVAAQGSGGSVVELFPDSDGRDDDAPDEDATQSATVDSLFAKLRAASTDDDDPTAHIDEPTTPEELAALHDTTELPVTDDLGLPGTGAEMTDSAEPSPRDRDSDASGNGSTTTQRLVPRDVAGTASGDEGSASDEEQPSERSERGQADSASDEPELSETDIASSETSMTSSPFARRDEELTPLIVAAARRVKRVLADEQNELLDTLRQSEPVVSIDALLPADGHQAARYVDSITTELEGAAQAGAASVSGDATTDVTRAGALGPVRDLIALNLVAPLRERVERCVADGDGDNDVITKRVRSVYREWKTQHVDNQLDDVFRLAYGRGVLVALPVGTLVRWLVDPNGPACPDAEDNSLAGTVPAGDPFPTGHVCAPAHAECRCLLAPAER
ncbi:MAG: DivIVA domain-containing protein [Actinomycetota bacterium]|nr:DivIVA domain-containing protein [Actinomycetota bacterium]